jgi:hypothetical protein
VTKKKCLCYKKYAVAAAAAAKKTVQAMQQFLCFREGKPAGKDLCSERNVANYRIHTAPPGTSESQPRKLAIFIK